jgi:hypothetical protein
VTLNVSKVVSISPAGVPAIGHQRSFAIGSFRVAQPVRCHPEEADLKEGSHLVVL